MKELVHRGIRQPACKFHLAFSATSATYRPPIFYVFVPLLLNNTSNLGTFAGGGNPGASSANGFTNIGGTDPHLKPQRATNYTIGLDVSPSVVPGLTLHGSYFNIKYYGTIGLPPHGFGVNYFNDYTSLYAMNPTYAQVVAAMTAAGVSPAQQSSALTNAGCTASSCNLYYISSDLTQNLGNSKVSGLDLGFDYQHEVGFGSIFASFNGTYLLNYQVSPSATATFSPNGVGNQNSGGAVSRFNFTSTLGANVGKNFRGQIKWNHVDGFDLATPAGLGQTHVGSFNTFDLYTSYDMQRGSLPPITLSLGITNLFDQNPPNYNGQLGQSNGYSGSTLGRVITVGATVKF